MLKNNKSFVPQLYIVCEDEKFGKCYLENLCKKRQETYNEHRTLVEHCGNNNSPEMMVKMAMKNSLELKRRSKLTRNASIFCIFDVDLNNYGGQTIDNRQKQIDNALKEASGHNIKIILNNTCIERWFLFHLNNSTASLNQKETLKQIQQIFKTYNKGVDFSEKQRVLKELLIYENYKKACTFIKKDLTKIHCISSNNSCYNIKNNPYSNMYELLEELKLIR
jgi:hypothetical protein